MIKYHYTIWGGGYVCIVMPLKVVEINGTQASGEINGMKKTVRIDLIESLEEGDYILINAGVALSRISKKKAKEIREYIDEMARL